MNSKVILLVALGMSAFGFVVLATQNRMAAKPATEIGGEEEVGSKDLITGSMDLSKFDELDVDIASLNFYLEKGDGYKLEYQVTEKNIPRVSESGDKLTVKQPSGSSFSFNFSSVTKNQYYKIIVPENAGVIDAELEAASGSINVDGVDIKGKVSIASGRAAACDVESKELKVSAASGKIDLSNVIVEKLNVDLTSGSFNATDCKASELDAELTSGMITFDRMSADEVDLDIMSGTVSMNLLGNKDDYDYKLESTSGSIVLDGSKVDRKFKSDAGRDKKIKVDLTSGKVDISFTE